MPSRKYWLLVPVFALACSGKLENRDAFIAPWTTAVSSGGSGTGDEGTGDGGTGGGGTGGGGTGGTNSGGNGGMVQAVGDPVNGALIYAPDGQACGSCHGADGLGTAIGSALVSTLPGLTRDQILDVITNGRPGTIMIAFSTSLTEQEILDVTEYIIATFSM